MSTRPDTEQASHDAPLRMAVAAAGRRDALRNRELILAAAQRLVAESGVDAVEIRDVARAAGVGVGTVYRRFGDKARLVAALLEERERLFADLLINGPEPLGPGAPPRVRLIAFLRALAGLTDDNLPLLRALQGSYPGARFQIGAYPVWRRHATALIHAAAPEVDAEWSADLILAPLAADLYHHQRYELGIPPERLRQNLENAVDALLTTSL